MGINDPNLPIGDMTPEEQALVDSCLSILNKKTSLTSEQQEKFKEKAAGALRPKDPKKDPKTEMYNLLIDTLQETFGKEDLIKNIDKLDQVVKEFKELYSEFELLAKAKRPSPKP